MSSGLLTAVTGPASVVYSDEASAASSQRARPLIWRGLNPLAVGRRRRGFIGMVNVARVVM
jgi:hypothetical protein